MKFLAAFAGIGVALFVVGCVDTVSGTHTAGFYAADSVQGRYQRPVSDVYSAALQVVRNNGVLDTEYNLHDTTNEVRALKATIDKEDVYIRVEAVDPEITQVTVQARTTVAGDVDEAHELEKEIALILARQ